MNKESLLILPQEELVTRHDISIQTEGEHGILGQQWPKLYKEPEWAGWMNYPNEPVTRFLILRDKAVIAHTAVCERQLENPRIKMAVLGGVLVIKEDRGKSYGPLILDTATKWIISHAEERKFDIATLTCRKANESAYKKFGWKTLPNSNIVRYGLTEEASHEKSGEELTMIIYLSPKAVAIQDDLESKPVYFGKPF